MSRVFSRIALRAEGADLRRLAATTAGSEYRMHQRLWDVFSDSPQRRRDFLYRQEGRGRPWFYALSARPPVDRDGLWEIQSKDYAPLLRRGQRLGFRLRVNPVRTRKTADGKRKRHDVVMEAKLRLRRAGTSREDWPAQHELVQAEGYAWLAERAESHGFAIAEGQVRVEGFRQHRLFKGAGTPPVTFSSADCTGLLTVTDPEGFLQALYNGIGPAKGFGCGLLLIRRV